MTMSFFLFLVGGGGVVLALMVLNESPDVVHSRTWEKQLLFANAAPAFLTTSGYFDTIVCLDYVYVRVVT